MWLIQGIDVTVQRYTAAMNGKTLFSQSCSGGLISKGHPLGATGLAQCAELSWQVGLVCTITLA